MPSLIDAIVRGVADPSPDPKFPHAPAGWSSVLATEAASAEGLALGDAHWETIRALQQYYARQDPNAVHLRGLHDALGEKFHHQGGLRYLYTLFPGGPVAQGCRIAGLKAPPGATDRGFGSVA